MNGNIISAANRLCVSIVLASLILVVGLRGASKSESTSDPKRDAAVAQASGEVSPENRVEDQGCLPRNDVDRIPIVDRVPGDTDQVNCFDPPREEEIWAKLAESKGSALDPINVTREKVRISIEKIGDKVDPCKVYPLAGPCQLVHCHYKCTFEFVESTRSDDPIPINHRKTRVEVVYIDKDHLRRCDRPEQP